MKIITIASTIPFVKRLAELVDDLDSATLCFPSQIPAEKTERHEEAVEQIEQAIDLIEKATYNLSELYDPLPY